MMTRWLRPAFLGKLVATTAMTVSAIAFAVAPAAADASAPATTTPTVAVNTTAATGVNDDVHAAAGWEFVGHYSTYITCAADGAWYVVFFNDIDDWECNKNPGGTYWQLWVHSTDCTCVRSEIVDQNLGSHTPRGRGQH